MRNFSSERRGYTSTSSTRTGAERRGVCTRRGATAAGAENRTTAERAEAARRATRREPRRPPPASINGTRPKTIPVAGTLNPTSDARARAFCRCLLRAFPTF